MEYSETRDYSLEIYFEYIYSKSMAFGDKLNDKRNFNRCNPSRRDSDSSNKREKIRKL